MYNEAKTLARIYLSTDSDGNEHKGKGKDGGQFTGPGKGGDKGARASTNDRSNKLTKLSQIEKKYKEVMELGRASGVEHSMVLDKSGEVLAKGKGDISSVDAGDHPNIDRLGSGLILLHNHPDNNVLSPQDFKAFDTYSGMDTIVAVTHDGTVHEARIIGDRRTLRKAVDAELVRITERVTDLLINYDGEVTDEVRNQLKKKRIEMMMDVGKKMEEKGFVKLTTKKLEV